MSYVCFLFSETREKNLVHVLWQENKSIHSLKVFGRKHTWVLLDSNKLIHDSVIWPLKWQGQHCFHQHSPALTQHRQYDKVDVFEHCFFQLTSASANELCATLRETQTMDGSIQPCPCKWFAGGKSPRGLPQQAAITECLSLAPIISTHRDTLINCPRTYNKILSQSGPNYLPGMSSIVTVATTSERNIFFSLAKLATKCLLLAVVALGLVYNMTLEPWASWAMWA